MKETLSNDSSSVLRLLRTPRPQYDESLMGYILRLTEENAYDAPSWIFELAGLKVSLRTGGRPTLYRSYFDYTLLREVIGLEHSEFECIRYREADFEGSMIISNRCIPTSCIRFSSPKICPACLKQANYYQSAWDLIPLTACCAHRTILIDKCPSCNKRISWSRKKMSVCPCGFDWRDCELVELAQQELEASRLIQNHYARSVADIPSNEGQNNPLFDLDLESLCVAVSFVADYYRSIKVERPITAKTENLICHESYSYSFSVFRDWPQNFYKFISWAERQAGRIWEVHELHRRICEQCNRSSLLFIVAACEDYIENHRPRTSGRFEFPLLSKRFINREDACQHLMISDEWLNVLIMQGKLEVFKRGDTDYELIDIQSIINLHCKLDNLMPIWTAAQLLNIDIPDVKELIYKDCLRPFSGPSVDGLPEWKFDYNGIEELIGRIQNTMIDLELIPVEKLMSIGRVIHQLKIHGLNVGDFVRAVLESKIVPQANLSYRGLSTFAFSKEHVMKYIQLNQPAPGKRMKSFRYVAEVLEKRREKNNRMFTNKVKDLYDSQRWRV